MSKHSDFSIQTRWFSIELTVCQFRESWWPIEFHDSKSVDVFVPLPSEQTLWMSFWSWWLGARLGAHAFESEALASTVPEPPHECAAEGCEFETGDYGEFLTHDVRGHYSPTDTETEMESR